MRSGVVAVPNPRDYVAMARPEYWFKHVFIVPGILAAIKLTGEQSWHIAYSIALGFISACLCASANYVLNEWLDAESDRHHPQKRARPAAAGRVVPLLVWLEYLGLVIIGLIIGYFVSWLFVVGSAALLISGVVYNVQPVRTKDIPYLDVLTEAFNNPIRLFLGWAMVSSTTVPPVSLLLVFWFGGAFLMAVKRLAEYRFVRSTGSPGALGGYRRSFQHYSEEKLLISAFLYSSLAAFAIAIFLMKYREEMILSVPLFAFLFAYYMHLGLKDNSITQSPEKLRYDRGLMMMVSAIVVVTIALAYIDLPFVEIMVQSKIPSLSLGK